MKSKSSLPCSEKRATGLYPEPGKSSTKFHTLLLLEPLFSYHLCLDLPSGLFLSGIPIKIFSVFLTVVSALNESNKCMCYITKGF